LYRINISEHQRQQSRRPLRNLSFLDPQGHNPNFRKNMGIFVFRGGGQGIFLGNIFSHSGDPKCVWDDTQCFEPFQDKPSHIRSDRCTKIEYPRVIRMLIRAFRVNLKGSFSPPLLTKNENPHAWRRKILCMGP